MRILVVVALWLLVGCGKSDPQLPGKSKLPERQPTPSLPENIVAPTSENLP